MAGARTVCGYTLGFSAAALLLHGVAEAQREFRVYPSFEGAEADVPLPADWQEPGELVIGRLYDAKGGDVGPILVLLVGASVGASVLIGVMALRTRAGRSDV